MRTRTTAGITAAVLAGVMTLGVSVTVANAEALAEHPRAEAMRQKPAASKARVKAQTPASWHAKRALYFERNWGVDVVGVHRVSSGFMLRFDYRVVDPDKAAALTDRKVRPYLIDEATGIALAVPAMENIGELRQVAPLEADRTYFVIFGNPGGLVKHGGHVTLVIGNFRAEGLVVE